MSGADHLRVPAARLRDWQSRLAALVRQRRHMPLQWGVHDCCLWAADAVQAVTGVDIAADVRGTYSTAEQAQAVLQAHGGLVELAIARLGPVVRTTDLVQAGDVGLCRVADEPVAVVCGGGNVWLAPGAAGLLVVPGAEVRRAWRCTRGGARG